MSAEASDVQFTAVMSEVRRQARHIAEEAGLSGSVEGQSRFFNSSDETWQVITRAEEFKKDGAWQEQQWFNAFELLIWGLPERLKQGHQQDDLIFLVLQRPDTAKGSPFLVRRKGKAVPADLLPGCPLHTHISWLQTYMLNLVLQTEFCLCVNLCRREDLSLVSGTGKESLPSSTDRVSGEVYASPSRVLVHGSKRKAGNEAIVAAYPDICFAVDESHTGFDKLVDPISADLVHSRQVLAEEGRCLHVQLTAVHSVAFCDDSSSCNPQAAAHRDNPLRKKPSLTEHLKDHYVQQSHHPAQNPHQKMEPVATQQDAQSSEPQPDRLSSSQGDDWRKVRENNTASDKASITSLGHDSSQFQDRDEGKDGDDPSAELGSKVGQKTETGTGDPVTLLSGFVSYEQVEDAMSKHRARLKKEGEELIISMKGPGGHGSALVTAKWCTPEDSGHVILDKLPLKQISSIRDYMSDLKLSALDFLQGTKPARDGAQHIHCAMLEIALPVNLIAYLILGVEL